jgi:hypothetical protein
MVQKRQTLLLQLNKLGQLKTTFSDSFRNTRVSHLKTKETLTSLAKKKSSAIPNEKVLFHFFSIIKIYSVAKTHKPFLTIFNFVFLYIKKIAPAILNFFCVFA